jgi:hypothetical protein
MNKKRRVKDDPALCGVLNKAREFGTNRLMASWYSLRQVVWR